MIAEACGWSLFSSFDDGSRFYDSPENGDVTLLARWPDADGLNKLPDYFGNLNACHEMEKILTDAQFEEYHYMLYEIEPFARPMGKRRNASSATATQRAEAFGRTLNLWSE